MNKHACLAALAALAAVIAFASAASAQTFAQRFLDKYDSYATGIKDGRADLSKPGSEKVSIDEDVKDGFDQKLKAAAKTAKCGAGERAAKKIDCSKATPDSIQDGLDALGELADEWRDAVKKDAGKTLLEIFQPQISQLKTQLKAAKIDSSDDQKLSDEIGKFQDSLGDKVRPGIDRKKPETYAQFTAAFQKVSDDVTAALSLAAADKGLKGTFLSDLETQWKQLLHRIDKSDLSEAFKAQFQRQLDQISLGEGCPRMGKLDKSQSLAANLGLKSSAGRWLRDPEVAPGLKRCKATDSDIQAAEKALQGVDASVTAALAKGSDGTESVYQIYQPQLQQLRQQLAKASLDETDEKAFQKRLAKMTDDFKAGEQEEKARRARRQGLAASGMASPKPGEVNVVITPDQAAAEIARFTRDLDAAVQLGQGQSKSGTDAEKFVADVQSLEKAIKDSKLDRPFKDALLKQAEQARDEGCAGKKSRKSAAAAITGRGKDTCPATMDSLAAGQTALQQANAALLAAEKSDGSKTLAALYQPEIQRLTEQLKGSKIDAADLKSLQASLADFAARLTATEQADDSKAGAKGASGKKAGIFGSPDEAQAAFQTLQQNVNAALQLASSQN